MAAAGVRAGAHLARAAAGGLSRGRGLRTPTPSSRAASSVGPALHTDHEPPSSRVPSSVARNCTRTMNVPSSRGAKRRGDPCGGASARHPPRIAAVAPRPWRRPRRSALKRRLRCGARPGVAPRNSLRSLRSLRSDSLGESAYEARWRAPTPVLRSSPPPTPPRAEDHAVELHRWCRAEDVGGWVERSQGGALGSPEGRSQGGGHEWNPPPGGLGLTPSDEVHGEERSDVATHFHSRAAVR